MDLLTMCHVQISKQLTLLEQEHGLTPTFEEIGDEMNMKAHDISLSLQHFERHFSLDAPNNKDGPDTLLDVLESTFAYQQYSKDGFSQALDLEVNRSLSTLT